MTAEPPAVMLTPGDSVTFRNGGVVTIDQAKQEYTSQVDNGRVVSVEYTITVSFDGCSPVENPKESGPPGAVLGTFVDSWPNPWDWQYDGQLHHIQPGGKGVGDQSFDIVRIVRGGGTVWAAPAAKKEE